MVAELRRALQAQGKARRGGSRLESGRGSSHKVWEALNFQEHKCGGLSNCLKCWVPVGFCVEFWQWQRSWQGFAEVVESGEATRGCQAS